MICVYYLLQLYFYEDDIFQKYIFVIKAYKGISLYLSNVHNRKFIKNWKLGMLNLNNQINNSTSEIYLL